MPFARDKIIINWHRNRGHHKAIDAEYQGLIYLATEMQQIGYPEKTTADLRDQLQVSCDTHCAADEAHLADLRALEKEMRSRIDVFLALKP